VSRLVEVLDADSCFGDRIDGIPRQQHRSQERFLGIEIVGRYATAHGTR
jgi:hypothetical protein